MRTANSAGVGGRLTLEMRYSMLGAVLLLGLQAQGAPLFTFHDGFWVNLNHFLYVLGRSGNGTVDSQAAGC